MSPGIAPRTATGPVIMWVPIRDRFASWIARSAGGIGNASASSGITSRPPDRHSMVTTSPDSTVSTGGIAASNSPNCTVSGVAATWWVREAVWLMRPPGCSDDGGIWHPSARRSSSGIAPPRPKR
jgi:hypothetical protein